MTTINAKELKDLLEKIPGMLLLNVRPTGAYSDGHLPGSLHVPQIEILERAALLLPDKEAWIVVYDADLTCEASTRAAQALESLGYVNVHNFADGLKGWREAGFEVQVEA